MRGEYTKKRTEADRFWEKVRKTEACWLWIGGKVPLGYGYMALRRNLKTVYMRVHRFSWELHFGPIPEGLEVCHNCPGGDNPACVNPAHLFLGAHRDNMKDMARKGRTNSRKISGENNHGAKLTEALVREARQLYAKGDLSFRKIARRFHVSYSAIKAAIKGQNWKHI
jgi:hypothetical protein